MLFRSIIATHDTAEVAEMTQRLTVIVNGFVIADDYTFSLRQKAGLYSARFRKEHGYECTFEEA